MTLQRLFSWLAIALGLWGCAPLTDTPSVAVPRPPAWSHVAEPGGVVTLVERRANRWHPYCNAFAVNRGGAVMLATAAHCLHEKPVGAVAHYLAPIGVEEAFIAFRDSVSDRALLAGDFSDLEAFDLVAPPGIGFPAVSVSSYYDARSTGAVEADLGEGQWETSLTIRKGWSGSPVLDTQGRAWGIVVRCTLSWLTMQCRDERAFVTVVP